MSRHYFKGSDKNGNDEYMRQWREANREKIRASRRAYYEVHRAETVPQAMQWNKQHPLEHSISKKVAAANRRYEGRIGSSDVLAVIERDGWKCFWCSIKLTASTFTLEHLRPFNDPEVLTLACHSCNSAKRPSCGWCSVEEREIFVAQSKEKRRISGRLWKIKHREHVNALARSRYRGRLG